MCGWVAGLTALGGLLQYRQQQAQANAQASMYRAQADAAQQNARIENRKQEQIADNYAQQPEALSARPRLAEGAQRAETGAAGLNFAGSAMDILSSGYDAYNKDSMNLLMNQRNDNYSSRVAESNYINQANQANASAANVKRQAKMSGLATILGTAASVYGVAQPWKHGNAAAQGSVQAGVAPRDMGYGTSAFYGSKTGYTFGTPYFPMTQAPFTDSFGKGFKNYNPRGRW